MTRHTTPLFGFLAALTLLGFGCASSPSSQSQNVSAPKPASFENLSPKDAARKINLVSPNVIVVRQAFSGPAVQIAKEMGWGSDATTTVVIKSFAPENKADIDWKRETIAASGTKMLTEQFTGTMVDGDLLHGHVIAPPSYWPEGTHEALGTGILWLGEDAFENFAKSKSGTLSFGILEPDFSSKVKSANFKKAYGGLNTRVADLLNRKDVYLATADDPSEWTLKLNGSDTKVQVITLHSWFGTMVVLDNPSNPLVLKVQTDPKTVGDLASLFDYDVTELRDLTQ